MMTTRKADRLRGKLAAGQKDREGFERRKAEMLAEMDQFSVTSKGRGKNGLPKEDDTKKTVTESPGPIYPSSISNVLLNPSKKEQQSKREKALLASINGQSDASADTLSVSSDSLLSPTTNSTPPPPIPTLPRLSNWCFTGSLDSSPPVVKPAKINEMYETIRLLGRGSFGDVNMMREITNNKVYACKSMFCAKDSELMLVLAEIKFLRMNKHPCIIDVHDAFIQAQPRVVYIMMSYCECGDLANLIATKKQNKQIFPENQIIKWMVQLMFALQFVHDKGTLHRDVKPNNILLVDGGDLLKLCDFGLAIDVKHCSKEKMTMEAGTPFYTAPEMIKGDQYSFPADCWSVGVIFHELFSQERPFVGAEFVDLARAILTHPTPDIPTTYSEEVRQACQSLLHKDPLNRPSMTQMLLEPAFLSKAAGFPSAYRPKALEDRVKRAHVKQLDTQLEKMVRLGRDSPYSPVSEEIAVGLILEETPGKEKAGGIEEDDDEEKSNPDAGMQPILMKPIQTKRVKTAEEKAMDRLGLHRGECAQSTEFQAEVGFIKEETNKRATFQRDSYLGKAAAVSDMQPEEFYKLLDDGISLEKIPSISLDPSQPLKGADSQLESGSSDSISSTISVSSSKKGQELEKAISLDQQLN